MRLDIKHFQFSPYSYLRYNLRTIHNKIRYRSDNVRYVRASNLELEAYRNDLIYVLSKKYAKSIRLLREKLRDSEKSMTHQKSNMIWVCWLQGIESAPSIVKACYNSILMNLSGGGNQVVLITEKNYEKYVSLPEDIVQKYKSKRISPALFSDLIRLELLNVYGGTWIDATVLCTSNMIPRYMLEDDLFLFRTVHVDAHTSATKIESWFMTAYSNHPLLLFTQALLLEYCRKYDFAVDYLIVYDFFELATESFPNLWEQTRADPRSDALLLHENWHKKYTEDYYQYLISKCPFHKLSYRYLPLSENDDDIYHHILSEYG